VWAVQQQEIIVSFLASVRPQMIAAASLLVPAILMAVVRLF